MAYATFFSAPLLFLWELVAPFLPAILFSRDDGGGGSSNTNTIIGGSSRGLSSSGGGGGVNGGGASGGGPLRNLFGNKGPLGDLGGGGVGGADGGSNTPTAVDGWFGLVGGGVHLASASALASRLASDYPTACAVCLLATAHFFYRQLVFGKRGSGGGGLLGGGGKDAADKSEEVFIWEFTMHEWDPRTVCAVRKNTHSVDES